MNENILKIYWIIIAGLCAFGLTMQGVGFWQAKNTETANCIQSAEYHEQNDTCHSARAEIAIYEEFARRMSETVILAAFFAALVRLMFPAAREYFLRATNKKSAELPTLAAACIISMAIIFFALTQLWAATQ